MAYTGTDALHGFTVQEATNLRVYKGYSSKRLTINDDDTNHNGDDWLSSGDGLAKEVLFVPISGDAANVIKISLKIGGSWGDAITILFDDLPLTINGLAIEQVRAQSSGGASTSELIEVISFH